MLINSCISVSTARRPELEPAANIAFVDLGIKDADILLQGMVEGVEVHPLPTDIDAIAYITATLQHHSNIGSIHIISHGSPGCLHLGNSELSLINLDHYADSIRNWGLTAQTSLLLYGCNVAAGDAGEEFLQKLSNITPANIAATSSLTGHPHKGGNWRLEKSLGSISIQLAVTPQTQSNFSGVLAGELQQRSSISITNSSPGSAILEPTINFASDHQGNQYIYGAFVDEQITVGDKVVTGSDRAYFGEVLPSVTSIALKRATDSYIAKINDDGTVAWAQGFVSDEYDDISAPQFDQQGNLYLGGNFHGNAITLGDQTLNRLGGPDAYFTKITPDGDIAWVRNLSSNDKDNSFRTSATFGAVTRPTDVFEFASQTAFATDEAGNSYVLGSFFGDSLTLGDTTLLQQGGGDSYITKIDSTGNIAWVTALASDGIDYREYLKDSKALPKLDSAGDLYFSGYSGGTSITLGNETITDAGPYVAKIDGDTGSILWAEGLEISQTPEFDETLILDKTNAYIEELVVNADDSLSIIDALNGDFQFQFDSNGLFSGFSSIASTVTLDGKSITAENRTNQAYKLEFNESGAPQGLVAVSLNNAQDSDGNVYATGSFITENASLGNTVISRTSAPSTYLAKIESSGELAWSQILSGSGGAPGAFLTTEISEPTLDSVGNVYVTGQFNSNNFSIGNEASLVNIGINGGENDAFLAKFSASGELSWVQQFASAGSDEISVPQLDADENVYVSGSFTGNSLLLDNTQVTNQSSRLGSSDYFLARFDGNGSLDWVNRTTTNFQLSSELGSPTITTRFEGDRFSSSTNPEIKTFEIQTSPTNPAARGDFNQDGRSDILLRNNAAGSHIIRHLDGSNIAQADSPISRDAITDPTWRTQTTGDFNGDGNADILLRHFTSGQNLLIAMNGSEIISESLIGRTVGDLNWEIVGSGDFNADDQDDILLYNKAAGQTLAWYMDSEGQILGESFVGRGLGENSGWDIVGTADFNRDLQTDIVLRHAESGQNLLWTMDNVGIAAEGVLGRSLQDPDWQVAGAGDFDGDGDGDLLWQYLGNAPANVSTGNDLIWIMEGTSIVQELQLSGISDNSWQSIV